MRKNISAIASLFFVSLTFFACEKNVNVNVSSKYTTPLLVLNSVLRPDTAATVQVSKSTSALDGSTPTIVVDATVDLWEDGKFKMNCANNGNGFYIANYKPLVGHSYTIKAHENGMTDVDATTTIPTLTPISVVSIDTTTEDIMLQINDPIAANYYSFSLNAYDSFGYVLPITLYTDNAMLLNNAKTPAFSFSRHGNRKLHPIPNYVGDDLFNGQNNTYDLSFNTINAGHGGHGGFQPPPTSLPSGTYVLKVTNVSAEIYKYFDTVDGANSVNPFAEPTQIYTNVNNGLGIVGSLNYQSFTVLKK